MQQYTRTFTRGDGQSVDLILNVPELEDGVWSCSYQIKGLGHSKAEKAFGADAIQAMVLALTCAATSLYFSATYENGELTFDGDADLGLPVAQVARDEIEAKKILVSQMINSRRKVP